MKFILNSFILLVSVTVFSQKDSLTLGERYWEDQLYISVTYNVLVNQPSSIKKSGFSYGLAGGYLKDIPFTKRGNIAAAIGLGYSYNSFNHGLKISQQNNELFFEADNPSTSNKLSLHTLEFPIELRWRTSTANKYAFWRVYAGVKLRYNLKNKFEYQLENKKEVYTNISYYNKFQTGITLSAGYGVFNFHLDYVVTPMFKEAVVGVENIKTQLLKLGLIFYIL